MTYVCRVWGRYRFVEIIGGVGIGTLFPLSWRGAIGGESGEAAIILWAADGKVVKRLPLGLRIKPENAMHRIVEETTDAGGTYAGGFGL